MYNVKRKIKQLQTHVFGLPSLAPGDVDDFFGIDFTSILPHR